MRARGIEQRQNTHHALGRVTHRAGENLVRRGDVGRHLGDMIDDDGALLQLHPGHQVLLGAVQRVGRHRVSAASQRQGDVLVRHPESRQGAAHVLQRALQDEVELVRIAGRGLVRRHLEHERQIAFAHAEIPFARPELEAQRQFPAQALERGLQELAHVGQGTRLGACTRESGEQAHDAEQLDVLAPDGYGVDRPVGVQANHARKLRLIGQGAGNRVLDRIELIAEIPILRGPYQIGIAVVYDHALEARHEHPQETCIGFEGGNDGVGLYGDRFDVQHFVAAWGYE